MGDARFLEPGAEAVKEYIYNFSVVINYVFGKKKLTPVQKLSGSATAWNYASVCGWKDGDNISLWSFRCRGVLSFALVPLR
ncbi:hypothetical protein YC2023_073197 [Brassica napus]